MKLAVKIHIVTLEIYKKFFDDEENESFLQNIKAFKFKKDAEKFCKNESAIQEWFLNDFKDIIMEEEFDKDIYEESFDEFFDNFYHYSDPTVKTINLE